MATVINYKSEGRGQAQSSVESVKKEVKPVVELMIGLKDSLSKLEDLSENSGSQFKLLNANQKDVIRRLREEIDALPAELRNADEAAQKAKEEILAKSVSDEGVLQQGKFMDLLLATETESVKSVNEATSRHSGPLEKVAELKDAVDSYVAMAEGKSSKSFASQSAAHVKEIFKGAMPKSNVGGSIDTYFENIFAIAEDVRITGLAKNVEYAAVLGSACGATLDKVNHPAEGRKMLAVFDGADFLLRQNLSDLKSTDPVIALSGLQGILDEAKNPKPATATSPQKATAPVTATDTALMQEAAAEVTRTVIDQFDENGKDLLKSIGELKSGDPALKEKLAVLNAEMKLYFGTGQVLVDFDKGQPNKAAIYGILQGINKVAADKAKELNLKVVKVKTDEDHKREVKRYLDAAIEKEEAAIKTQIDTVVRAIASQSKIEEDKLRGMLDRHFAHLELLKAATRKKKTTFPEINPFELELTEAGAEESAAPSEIRI
ncbi:Uncharacterised protein [uncultured archaeon]|nr:Uncharacterised protein [uncultured archaeon]